MAEAKAYKMIPYCTKDTITYAMDELVRCKDCKNLGYTNSHWFCKWLNRCVDEDWFCADGEAKT